MMTEEGRQTAGTTTALIVRYLRAVGGDDLVARVLDVAGESRSAAELEDETNWSTYGQKVALFGAAEQVLSDPSVARKIGASVLENRIGTSMKLLLNALGSPAQVVKNISKVASKFSTVCEMETVHADERRGTVRYRVTEGVDPHRSDCLYNIGLLSQVPVIFGLAPAVVEHATCQIAGDPWCVYEMSWGRRRRRPGVPGKHRVAELEEEVALLKERAAALESTTTDLVSADNLEEILDRVARKAAAAVQAQGYVLSVRMRPDADLEIRSHGVSSEAAEQLAATMQGGVDPFAADRFIAAEVASARFSYGHIAAVYPERGGFLPGESGMLEAYARQAAAALDVTAALEASRSFGEAAFSLLWLARELAEAESLQGVLETLAQATPIVLGADSGTVLLWDEEAEVLSVRATCGLRRELAETLGNLEITPDDTPELKRMFSDRLPQVHRLDTEDPFIEAMLKMFEGAATANVPIWVRNKPIGVISVLSSDPSFGKSSSTLDMRLLALADQAGIAVENMRLLEGERSRAARSDSQSTILELVARGADLDATLEAIVGSVEAEIPGATCAVVLTETGRVSGGIAGDVAERLLAEVRSALAEIRVDPSAAPFELGDTPGWLVPIRPARSTSATAALVLLSHRRVGASDLDFLHLVGHLTTLALDRKTLEEQLTHQAFHDPLTRLPNRLLLRDRVQHALARLRRNDTHLGVLFIDLDDFKSINDNLGHAPGDAVLREVARRISATLRGSDTAARLGGDEFAILLEETDRQGVRIVAERLLASLHEPMQIGGVQVWMKASVGIAMAPEMGESVDDLLTNADNAMYTAKTRGKGRYEFFERSMRVRPRQRFVVGGDDDDPVPTSSRGVPRDVRTLVARAEAEKGPS